MKDPTAEERNRDFDFNGELVLNIDPFCMFVLEYFYFAYGQSYSSALLISDKDIKNVLRSLFATAELGRKIFIMLPEHFIKVSYTPLMPEGATF